MHSYADLRRTDGPPDALAHGQLSGSPVALFAADTTGDEEPLRCEGLMLVLLGTAAPETLRRWFTRLRPAPERIVRAPSEGMTQV